VSFYFVLELTSEIQFAVIFDQQPLSESDVQEGGEGIKNCESSVGSTSQSDRCRRGPQVDPAIKLLDENISGKEKVKLCVYLSYL
jgi:hypothetical protein